MISTEKFKLEVLLNQSAFVFPFFSWTLVQATSEMLGQKLGFDPTIFKVEARVLESKNIPIQPWWIQEFKFVLRNALGNSIFGIKANTILPTISFDLPDILEQTETERIGDRLPFEFLYTEPKRYLTELLKNLVINLSQKVWLIASVSNFKDFYKSVEIAFDVSEGEEIRLHTTSKEILRFFYNDEPVFERINRFANESDKKVTIGIEIDHSIHKPLEWLIFVANLVEEYRDLTYISFKLDIDFTHIHESFIKNGIYKYFEISVWDELFASIKEHKLQISDYHLHDGSRGATHLLEGGDLAENWSRIFSKLFFYGLFPENITLEFMPWEIRKLWTSSTSRKNLEKLLVMASNNRLPRI
jgi:hypothetical protein